MKNMKKIRLLLIAVATVLGLMGCSRKKQLEQHQMQYLTYFDTITSITVCAESEDQFSGYKSAVDEEIKKYHELFDAYNNYEGITNIKTINDNAGLGPVEVSRELMDLLKFGVEQYEATNGRVNIAMGSVLSLWHDCREEASENPEDAMIPDEAQLIRANEYTDIHQMQLNEEKMQVYLPDKHMRLDVGAVAKGYATHRIAELLREQGVTSALLSVGGNIETIGVREDGKPWRVGVQNPDLSSNQPYLHVLELQDMALVTSGVYQRFYEVDGVRYHHIIHPELLKPWDKYLSVSILAQDGGLADAYSTAVFNMEPEEGVAFIEAREGIEALWILADGTEIYSSGFKNYMSE